MKVRLLFFGFTLCFGIQLSAQFDIGRQTTTYTDAARSNRGIPSEVFYPATSSGTNTPVANGSFPVIVFGHGFSMNYDAYQNFWEELVPQGYILVFPKTETATIPFPDHGALGSDISFLVDLFLEKGQDTSDVFYQKVNGKTSVMGHSMGGGCSFLAAEANANVTVISGFAPAETNVSAIAAAKNINIPALIFSGELDNVAPEAGHNLAMYDSLASNCKTRVTVKGGSHCGFGISNTACNFGEVTVCIGCNFISRADQHRVTFEMLVPWLAFYLRGDCIQWDVFNTRIRASSEVTFQQQCNYQLPEASISILGDTTLCEGDSVQLVANGDFINQWSNGASTDTITVSQSGTYFLEVTDDMLCKDTSASVQVGVNLPIEPQFVSSQLGYCRGDSVQVSLNGAFSAFQWSTGDTNSSIWVKKADSVSVRTVDINGCVGMSDTVAIVQYTDPDTPLISQSSDTLFSSGNGSFQWYFEGVKVNGANGFFIRALTDGAYTVEYTDTNSCMSSLSAVFSYVEGDTITSISLEPVENEVQIYPNPATSGVALRGVRAVPLNPRLFNYSGREFPVSIRVEVGELIQLYWQPLPPGIYFIEVEGKVYKLLIIR